MKALKINLRELFRLFDDDNSGLISRDAFVPLLEYCKIICSENDALEAFKIIDVASRNIISFPNLAMALAQAQEKPIRIQTQK